MDLKLKGKSALVTGGSHGIGKAIALSLAGEGCRVAICSRSRERIDAALEELKAVNPECWGIETDVLSPGDIDRCCDTVLDRWGTLHILINNVGGGGRWGSAEVEKTDDKVWLEVFQKNAMAAVRFTTRFLPYMRKQLWGRVLTITSIYGREGGGRPWFNMAKSAEISMMKSLALDRDLVRDGITFNSVAPGCIMIPNTGWEKEQAENPEKFAAMLESDFPLGRMGAPEEVADVVAFICSEKASLVNGACVTVDGGQSRSF